MPLEKRLEQITEKDILAIIADQEREGRVFNYKR